MRTILRGTILLGLAAGCWIAPGAQDKSKPAAGGGQDMASMPMPKPAPEMTKMIKMMSGTWNVTEKSDPSPMFPKGGSGKGTAKMWAGPGDMSLLESYHSSGLMGTSFNGAGTFWWDAKAGVYHGLWCDSMTPGGCDGSGTTRWDGDKLVGTMEGDMNGQKMVSTFTYSDWKPNSFVMTMASGSDSNSMKPMMTITYTRAGGAMAKSDEMKH